MMGIREYARHRAALGLPGATHGAVQNAIKTGRLSKSVTKAGKIRSEAAADIEWSATTKADYIPVTGPTSPRRKTRQRSTGKRAPAADPPSDLSLARARREGVNADLAEIELAKARRELVPVREAEASMADAFLQVRMRLLGCGVRAREAAPETVDDAHRLYDALIREALEVLASNGAR